MLPIHWGTFSPEDMLGGLPRWLPETGRRFERALAERDLLDRLVRLEPGADVPLVSAVETSHVETSHVENGGPAPSLV